MTNSTDDVAVANVQTIQEALDKGEKVLGVIGHLNSGQTIAAMELVQQDAHRGHHPHRLGAIDHPA